MVFPLVIYIAIHKRMHTAGFGYGKVGYIYMYAQGLIQRLEGWKWGLSPHPLVRSTHPNGSAMIRTSDLQLDVQLQRSCDRILRTSLRKLSPNNRTPIWRLLLRHQIPFVVPSGSTLCSKDSCTKWWQHLKVRPRGQY
jgi:hypothetical protein